MELVLRAPDGAVRGTASAGAAAPFGLQWFYANFKLDSTVGTWTVEVTVNGATARTMAVAVN